MATQRAATYCSVPPQDGHHRGDSWRLSRLRNARPSAQKSPIVFGTPGSNAHHRQSWIDAQS